MTTTTADATLLGAAPPAPAAEFRPDPEAPFAPPLSPVPEPQPEPLPQLQADPSVRFVPEPQPDPEPVPELQADPSLRFGAEPQPEAAYASAVAEARSVAVPRKSWREQRAERRRRRIWLEEVLAWILVPVIVLGTWWFVDTVLTALGTSPAAIINGLSAIVSAL